MNQVEYKIQVAIVQHHETAFPGVELVHVPNASNDPTRAYFAKQMGAKAGAHDLFIFWKGGHGIVEVKQPGEYLSTDQNKFASRMSHLGAKTGIARSVKQYHQLLVSWGVEPAHEAIKEPNLATAEEKFRAAIEAQRPPS